MLKFLKKIFQKTPKKQERLHAKLKSLETGDYVIVDLEPNFCSFSLTQPMTRFTEKNLKDKKIKGLVIRCAKKYEFGFYVLEIVTVFKDVDMTIYKNILEITEDEIQDIERR